MLDRLHQRLAADSEPTEQRAVPDMETDTQDVTKTALFRLGRLVYGGILTMMAVDGLRNVEERAQYAEAKDVPVPKFATMTSHWVLLVGGIGISLWRFPALAASAIVTFFLTVTPEMHDFWNIDDPEQKQQQMIHFLKNMALLGTALILLGLAEHEE
ncbi:DoxX family protein [halophilic archaeon]|nr:DoxX family protein [halophilic archaeon]